MQADWSTVQCSYSACFLVVEGEACLPGHVCCRCCTQSRRNGSGVKYLKTLERTEAKKECEEIVELAEVEVSEEEVAW